MTPQQRTEKLAGQSGSGCASLGEVHLTGEQFGELMAGSAEAAGADVALVEAHLLVCERCAAELANLREAISFFREASSAYADDELRRKPRWEVPARRSFSRSLVPAYWVAAAAMFLTALFPLQVLRRHTVAPSAAVATSTTDRVAVRSVLSDEALLEDVNSEISASVPTSMQALADPTADASTVNNESSVPTTNQRKD
jgi:anti-sigma factor RsiW